jgi:FlaA1/EpsC-like NDP-sugar epimerase
MTILPQSNVPRWLILAIDLVISLLALALAYLIRFDVTMSKQDFAEEWPILWQALPLFLVVKLTVFLVFRTHMGMVRHTSTQDLKRVFLAVSASTGILLVLLPVRYYLVDEKFFLPLSIVLVEYLASFFLLLFFRFSVKLIYLEAARRTQRNEEPVLIYGAGVSGLITKRTIEKDQRIAYKIIGFIDDNKKLKHSRIEGMPIYHTDELEDLITNHGVKRLIVAIQKPDIANKNRVVDICLAHDIEVMNVPSAKSWINGEFNTRQIRKINIEDLLGREPIQLDSEPIQTELAGKVVLVTGAAGSIGSGLVRQIEQYQPKLLILLDQAESGLYDLHNEIRQSGSSANLEVVIGDVRSHHRMRKVFESFKPDYVFHAAAYKHVPLMEDNPSEAILTNVKGTRVLVDLALEFKVYKFIMISTDKAVNPTNVMGASKRIAEMYAQQANQNGITKFITTRFGNVLGSNGSVIPLFKRQIERGGPVTVTDERVTRYFMTIPEACQLVLEAGAMGEGGEIFVFDMGKSVKIIDLAHKMIKLSGLEPGKDIAIRVTGLRPGEKLYEELLATEENTLPTHHPKILKARVREVDKHVKEKVDELVAKFDAQDNFEIVAAMKRLVPEFISNNSVYSSLDSKRNDN